MSTSKTPRTIVEVIEEVPADAGIPLIRVSHVLINGQPVTVAKDGIDIDYDYNIEGSESTLNGGIVAVNVTLLVNEFSIKQAPTGYSEGKASTSSGAHLHFDATGIDGATAEAFINELEQNRMKRD